MWLWLCNIVKLRHSQCFFFFFLTAKSSNSTITDTDSSARAEGNTYVGSSVCLYSSHRSSHIPFVRLAHCQLYVWIYDVMKEICQAEPSLDTLHSSVCSNRIRCRMSQAESKPRGPLDKADHWCLRWREILEISIYSYLYLLTDMSHNTLSSVDWHHWRNYFVQSWTVGGVKIWHLVVTKQGGPADACVWDFMLVMLPIINELTSFKL